MTDLTDLGIAGIRDGVRDGSFSARDVADAFIVKVSKAKALNALAWGTTLPRHPPLPEKFSS